MKTTYNLKEVHCTSRLNEMHMDYLTQLTAFITKLLYVLVQCQNSRDQQGKYIDSSVPTPLVYQILDNSTKKELNGY